LAKTNKIKRITLFQKSERIRAGHRARVHVNVHEWTRTGHERTFWTRHVWTGCRPPERWFPQADRESHRRHDLSVGIRTVVDVVVSCALVRSVRVSVCLCAAVWVYVHGDIVGAVSYRECTLPRRKRVWKWRDMGGLTGCQPAWTGVRYQKLTHHQKPTDGCWSFSCSGCGSVQMLQVNPQLLRQPSICPRDELFNILK